MAEITVIEEQNKGISGSSYTYFYPTSLQAGDLIVIIQINKAPSSLPLDSNGAYLIEAAAHTYAGYRYIWYKIAVGNESYIKVKTDYSQYAYQTMLIYRGEFNTENLLGSTSASTANIYDTNIKVDSLDYNSGDLIIMADSYITNREATANQTTPFVFTELLDMYKTTGFYGSIHEFSYIVPEDTVAGSTGDFYINLTCSRSTSSKGAVAAVFTKALPPAQIINKTFYLS